MIRVVPHHAAVEWLSAYCWLSPFGPLAFICNFAAATMYWFLGLNQSWI